MGFRVLVSNKDAKIFLCKLSHFVFISFIFQMKNLMYQGSHCSAFKINMNFLFFVILQLFLKKPSPFRKNTNHAIIAVTSSSKGTAIFFLKRKNSNLNILDILFFNLFPI